MDDPYKEEPPYNYPRMSILNPLIRNTVPNRPRFPPEGFEDPPVSQLQPTWYRDVPPKSTRAAIEAQGLSWDKVLQDFEERREAMMNADERDIAFENGRIVWKKPSEETVRKRIEDTHQLRQWGFGWRSYVLWTVWKVMGSPEGVYETDKGKLDGKLVLRGLKEGKKTEGSPKNES
jgi:hypothetical protein